MEFNPELLTQPAARQDHSDSTGSARANSLTSQHSWTTEDTEATSVVLAPLQEKGASQDTADFDPIDEEDPSSFDLVAPASQSSHRPAAPLEKCSQQLFSREHLRVIFKEPPLFRRFAKFLSTHRPSSLSILIYYLDAEKSLKAIAYANALASSLNACPGLDFTQTAPEQIAHRVLQDKADKAFDVLVEQELPAYITHNYINIVSASISSRIAGTLAPHLHEASEGLAEVFCLTDPSRPDNPIVFASEEFNRTTQYGMNYIVGRNCKFLQGPATNPSSVQRIGEAIKGAREHSEVFLNYRRDGSPFLNLLMVAPLRDSKGRLRYFIGAQVDVSGLLREGTDVDGYNKMLDEESRKNAQKADKDDEHGDDFVGMCELFNHTELKTVANSGGRIYREQADDDSGIHIEVPQHQDDRDLGLNVSTKPRLLLREPSSDEEIETRLPSARGNGKLTGVYTNYLLVRPYPSLRILFTSPSLRVPGILQSPLMSRIGGSGKVRDGLAAALAEGRVVTAKVRWISRFDAEGRSRYLHFTPLIGANGQIGVWMVVLVDAESKQKATSHRAAPIVDDDLVNNRSSSRYGQAHHQIHRGDRQRALKREDERSIGGSSRASSPYSVNLV